MPSQSSASADNRSRYAILGALTLHPMSGYDLKRFFAENLGYFWSESYGQIYPMLRALHAAGLVEPVPEADGRRKPYRITPAGEEALRVWLAAPVTPEPGRVEILLKMFFASHAAPGVMATHLADCRAEHTARLAEYRALWQRLEQEHAGDPALPNWLATLAYGVRASEAMLAWCDDVEQLRGRPV